MGGALGLGLGPWAWGLGSCAHGLEAWGPWALRPMGPGPWAQHVGGVAEKWRLEKLFFFTGGLNYTPLLKSDRGQPPNPIYF